VLLRLDILTFFLSLLSLLHTVIIKTFFIFTIAITHGRKHIEIDNAVGSHLHGSRSGREHTVIPFEGGSIDPTDCFDDLELEGGNVRNDKLA